MPKENCRSHAPSDRKYKSFYSIGALGNLARLVATYQGLPGRVVHMRALDAQAVDALSGDVNQELDRMNHEMAAFEETLKVTPPEVRA